MEKDIIINKIKSLIMRSLIVMVLFLTLAITCKGNVLYKDYIYNYVYRSNFSFASLKNIYDDYLGGVFPGYDVTNVNAVFDEKFSYIDAIEYHNGVKLMVNRNYLVPILKEGIVVYVGEKENYGNVIMVEDSLGIDTWYGNICNSMVQMYDNLSAGSYIGEACGDYIYLVYSKGNIFLDYKDYLE